MCANAMDVEVILPASLPCRCLALDGDEIVASEANLFTRDAGVRAVRLMLGSANDAIVVRATADGAVIV